MTGEALATSSGFTMPTAEGLGEGADPDMLLALSSWPRFRGALDVLPNGFLPIGVPWRLVSPSPDCPVAGAGDPAALTLPPT